MTASFNGQLCFSVSSQQKLSRKVKGDGPMGGKRMVDLVLGRNSRTQGGRYPLKQNEAGSAPHGTVEHKGSL